MSPSLESRRLLVLFGSETGCAEDVAHAVARDARRRRFAVRVSTMDDYDRARLIDEPLVVFVCSTTGQGQEPANMRRFWRFLLRKDLPRDSLDATRFAVFGLGDSAYPRFNFPAKKLFKRLLQLGAVPLVDRGDGDDQHYLGSGCRTVPSVPDLVCSPSPALLHLNSVDGALDPWSQQLWAKLDALYPLPPGTTVVPKDVLPPPTFQLLFTDSPTTDASGGANADHGSDSTPASAPAAATAGAALQN
ncbi:NADPH-dependent diflavin oxidoreductase 1, partial [Cladochytrium tenue]